jgi:hypothetical protein
LIPLYLLQQFNGRWADKTAFVDYDKNAAVELLARSLRPFRTSIVPTQRKPVRMNRNYRAERRRSARNAVSYKLPMRESAVDKIPYAARPYRNYSDTRFRAKLGFPLKIDVLPTKPLQTASAVGPFLPTRPALRRKPLEIPLPASRRSAPDPQPSSSSALPPAPAQAKPLTQPIERSNRSLPETRLPPVQPERKSRNLKPLRLGLYATLAAVGVATVLGTFLHYTDSGSAMLVQTAPIPTGPPPSEIAMAEVSPPTASSWRQSYQASLAGRTRADSHIKGISANDRLGSTKQSWPFTVSEPQAASVAAAPVESAASRQATANTSTKAATNTPPHRDQDRLASQSTTLPRVKDRTVEMSRSKKQASSDTEKTSAAKAQASRESIPTKRKAARAVATRAPGNGKRSIQKGSLAAQFKQCRQKDRFLEREKCKWRLCAGNWGNDGCPAYNHEIARF